MTSASDASQPVTVVVATRNRWHDLRQSLPRHDKPVILVDNGSEDGTPHLVRQNFAHVKVVELERNRGATARNVGVAAARTPYVAFADDDSWWAPRALTLAAGLLDASPRLALIAGRVLVGPLERVDAVSRLMAGAPLGSDPDLPGPNVLGFLACAAVVRRDAYLAAGGFDDVVFFFGEEERLALDLAAAGWGMAYVDDVVAHHHPSPTRGGSGREVLAVRNRLLTAVLRRPWSVVACQVAAAARGGPRSRQGLAAAVPRFPAALAQRRRLPVEVESRRRLLELAGGGVAAPEQGGEDSDRAGH